MTHDLILIAVTLAVFHLELAVVLVLAGRNLRKAVRLPFPGTPMMKAQAERAPYAAGRIDVIAPVDLDSLTKSTDVPLR